MVCRPLKGAQKAWYHSLEMSFVTEVGRAVRDRHLDSLLQCLLSRRLYHSERRGVLSSQVRVFCYREIVGDHSYDKLIRTFGTIVLVVCVCVDALWIQHY